MKNHIEERRKALGMTQAAVGVGTRRLAPDDHFAREREYNPSILLAHSIARLFGERIEDIFIFEEEEA